jgi:hypothetical protein
VGDSLIPLVDAIRALRAQLTIAIKESKSQTLRFDLKSVEFEFNAVLSREGSGGTKLSFMLFGLGVEGSAGGKISAQHAQKIKLVLSPFDTANGDDPDGAVEHRSVSISSTRPRARSKHRRGS